MERGGWGGWWVSHLSVPLFISVFCFPLLCYGCIFYPLFILGISPPFLVLGMYPAMNEWAFTLYLHVRTWPWLFGQIEVIISITGMWPLFKRVENSNLLYTGQQKNLKFHRVFVTTKCWTNLVTGSLKIGRKSWLMISLLCVISRTPSKNGRVFLQPVSKKSSHASRH